MSLTDEDIVTTRQGQAFAQAADFAGKYWNTEPLLVRAGDLPGPFDDLLSAGDVDGLFAERGLRAPYFRLVRDGTNPGDATRTATVGSRTVTDLADPQAVA